MTSDTELTTVDHAALRVNQAVIIPALIVAFIIDAWWLVAVVAAFMAAGTALGMPGFGWLYRTVLKPLGLVRPDPLQDNREPHRFAQGFGAVVLGGALAALLAGASVPGWALVWLVVGLAALNLFVGFCAGCFVYYWLTRRGVPGFDKRPPPNTPAGMRPPREV